MKELDKAIKRESEYILENEGELKKELASAYNFATDLKIESWTYGKRLYKELQTEYNGGHTRRALMQKLGYIDILTLPKSELKKRAIDSFIRWSSNLKNDVVLNHYKEREGARTKFRLLVHPSLLETRSIYYRNKEREYINWIQNNPEGFVVNIRPSATSQYYVLHNPSCSHISKTKQPFGAFTERDYCKLCSNDLNEIEEWLYKNKDYYDGDLQLCKTCKPLEQKEREASGFLYPEMEPSQIDDVVHTEGAKSTATVNRYERDTRARQKCLDYYGYQCQVCTIDFETTYGLIGKEFIHVHHIVPISERGSEYIIKPTKDLVPVCPNCHAMLHRRNPPYSVDEMIDILKQNELD